MPDVGELMDLQRKDTSESDTFALKIVRDQCTVGHTPRDITNWCSYLLL